MEHFMSGTPMNENLWIFMHLCCYHKRLLAECLRAMCVHPDIIDAKTSTLDTISRCKQLKSNRKKIKNKKGKKKNLLSILGIPKLNSQSSN